MRENQDRGREDKENRRNDQDFGIAVKELLEGIQDLRKIVRNVVAVVKSGGYSRAALRYTNRKIDELIGELQACKDYLKALE